MSKASCVAQFRPRSALRLRAKDRPLRNWRPAASQGGSGSTGSGDSEQDARSVAHNLPRPLRLSENPPPAAAASASEASAPPNGMPDPGRMTPPALWNMDVSLAPGSATLERWEAAYRQVGGLGSSAGPTAVSEWVRLQLVAVVQVVATNAFIGYSPCAM